MASSEPQNVYKGQIAAPGDVNQKSDNNQGYLLTLKDDATKLAYFKSYSITPNPNCTTLARFNSLLRGNSSCKYEFKKVVNTNGTQKTLTRNLPNTNVPFAFPLFQKIGDNASNDYYIQLHKPNIITQVCNQNVFVKINSLPSDIIGGKRSTRSIRRNKRSKQSRRVGRKLGRKLGRRSTTSH